MLSVMEERGGRQQQLELHFLSCASDSCDWIRFRDRKHMLPFRAFNIKYLSRCSLSPHKMKRDGWKCPNLNERRVSAGLTQRPGLAYHRPAMLAVSFALSLVSFIYTWGSRECPRPRDNLPQRWRRLVPQIIKLHGSMQKLCFP